MDTQGALDLEEVPTDEQQAMYQKRSQGARAIHLMAIRELMLNLSLHNKPEYSGIFKEVTSRLH